MGKRNPSSLSLSPSSLGAEHRESGTTTPRMPRECAQCPPRRKLNYNSQHAAGPSGQPGSIAAEVWKALPLRSSRGRSGLEGPALSPPCSADWPEPRLRSSGSSGRGGLGAWRRFRRTCGGPAQRHGDQARAGHEARHGRGRRGGRSHDYGEDPTVRGEPGVQARAGGPRGDPRALSVVCWRERRPGARGGGSAAGRALRSVSLQLSLTHHSRAC